jgi:glycine/D-amino acid oxidase-like deaminating enzyme
MRHPGDSLWSATAPLPEFPPLERDLAADVAIVGGGITGLTLAALLAEAGRRVAVVERNRLGSGTTGRTTAHVTAAFDVDFATLVSRFGEERARRVTASVLRAIDEIERGARAAPDCAFRRVPGFRFPARARGDDGLEEERDRARSLGLEASLVSEVPLPFPCERALRLERQAAFHPLAYLRALAGRVVRAGGEIFEESPVVSSTDDGIETSHGTHVRAASVVDATHTPVGLVSPTRSSGTRRIPITTCARSTRTAPGSSPAAKTTRRGPSATRRPASTRWRTGCARASRCARSRRAGATSCSSPRTGSRTSGPSPARARATSRRASPAPG